MEGLARGLGPRRYVLKPVRGFWFTSFLIERLRGFSGCLEVSLDLGVSLSGACVSGGRLAFGSAEVDLASVSPSEPDRVVLLEESGALYEVIRHDSGGFYKLKALGERVAPTIEVNGIHMHRIKGIDPMTDALLKVRAARVGRGHRVLDTCMGLGYTAIQAIKRGASEVYTFEVDKNVVWIAERNPWSRGLANPRISVFLEDVTEAVKLFGTSYFDRIIHDPPRFTPSTGELYGLEFYKELFRVLKPGGVLYHYTGEPHRHGGPRVVKGIGQRLMSAGFVGVHFDRRSMGFVAIKPFEP